MRSQEQKEVLFREMRAKYKGGDAIDAPTYSVGEAAEILGWGQSTVHKYIKGDPRLLYLPRNPHNATGNYHRKARITEAHLLALMGGGL